MNEIAEEPSETTFIVYESERVKNTTNFNFSMGENIKSIYNKLMRF